MIIIIIIMLCSNKRPSFWATCHFYVSKQINIRSDSSGGGVIDSFKHECYSAGDLYMCPKSMNTPTQ